MSRAPGLNIPWYSGPDRNPPNAKVFSRLDYELSKAPADYRGYQVIQRVRGCSREPWSKEYWLVVAASAEEAQGFVERENRYRGDWEIGYHVAEVGRSNPASDWRKAVPGDTVVHYDGRRGEVLGSYGGSLIVRTRSGSVEAWGWEDIADVLSGRQNPGDGLPLARYTFRRGQHVTMRIRGFEGQVGQVVRVLEASPAEVAAGHRDLVLVRLPDGQEGIFGPEALVNAKQNPTGTTMTPREAEELLDREAVRTEFYLWFGDDNPAMPKKGTDIVAREPEMRLEDIESWFREMVLEQIGDKIERLGLDPDDVFVAGQVTAGSAGYLTSPGYPHSLLPGGNVILLEGGEEAEVEVCLEGASDEVKQALVEARMIDNADDDTAYDIVTVEWTVYYMPEE